ncbi:MAG: zinc-dependent alcohol dehydrogenase [Candidatus Poribacteria bacterium]
MKAGIIYGPMDIVVEEIEKPSPGYGEVLLQVKSAGICGSDLHYHRSKSDGNRVRRIMSGHELSGIITEIGKGVKSRKVGERVGVEPLLGCGNCQFCHIGDYHLCSKLSHPGGGFREYTALLEDKVFPIPDHVSYDESAILDCFAVGVHAVHKANITITDTVAVMGDGAIGLATLEVAKATGAKKLALIGHHQKNLDIASKVGAEITINSSTEDEVQRIMQISDGLGVDVVFETVGSTANTLEKAIQMTKPGGKIIIIGIFTKPIELNLWRPLRYEVDIIFSYSYSTWKGQSEFEIALDLLAKGKLDANSLITHRFPLDRLSDAFKTALNKEEYGALKVLVTCD